MFPLALKERLMQGPLLIGTRGSQLALAQAELIKKALLNLFHNEQLSENQIQVQIFKTTGDRIQNRPLSEVGGKGLFTKEIEQALYDKKIDLAVHSMKDVATLLPQGLDIPVVLTREDPRDVFISPKASSLADLPLGGRVGTASLRRQALLKAVRPDLETVLFRGNINTRLRKLDAGEVDATFLAYAGLKRLHLEEKATQIFDVEEILPAPAQGVIGLQVRSEDHVLKEALAPLNHVKTFIEMTAERAVLSALDGSCRTPLAAYAVLEQGPEGLLLSLQALLASVDGQDIFKEKVSCTLSGTTQEQLKQAFAFGHDLGSSLKQKAGPDFYAKLQALL